MEFSCSTFYMFMLSLRYHCTWHFVSIRSKHHRAGFAGADLSTPPYCGGTHSCLSRILQSSERTPPVRQHELEVMSSKSTSKRSRPAIAGQGLCSPPLTCLVLVHDVFRDFVQQLPCISCRVELSLRWSQPSLSQTLQTCQDTVMR